MPEFNLVNHRFYCALDTFKSITIVIQESEQEWQEIYYTLQLCTDLISNIKQTTEKYLNRDRFAEPLPFDTNSMYSLTFFVNFTHVLNLSQGYKPKSQYQ